MTEDPRSYHEKGLLAFVPRPEIDRALGVEASSVFARTSLFATLARINTLYLIKRAGSGHLGSSFSSLDLVSWLLLNELKESARDRSAGLYFSSKGHDAPGLYAALIGLGQIGFEKIHELRRLGGLPGHPDVATPGVVTNTGSLGMGISKAKGLALAARQQGRRQRVFVMTGDGELQEGQIWESLLSASNLGLGEIVVIVDHNKLQSDTLVSSTSSLGDLEAKFSAFGWCVQRCSGHDMNQIATTLDEVRDAERPCVVIADTIKGAGVSFMEHTAMSPSDGLYRFHSGAPGDDDYRRALDELVSSANRQLAGLGLETLTLETKPASEKKLVEESRLPPERDAPLPPERLIDAYGRALCEQARKRHDIVALDADLILDCGLIPFREQFPDRFLECGIAEQDMVSQAGGLARGGLLPVVHSFACFLSTRPNEQIYNNATERSKIVYVGSLAGVLPAGPGHSHQSVRDIACLSAIPGLVLIEPCCETQVAAAVDYAIERNPTSTYLRLVSIPWPLAFERPPRTQLTEGVGQRLRSGSEIVVIGYGPVMLSEAWKAAVEIEAELGLRITLINLPWLNRVDEDWLRSELAEHRHVVTLDNHYVAGGQGQFLAAKIAQLGLARPPSLTLLGLDTIPECGRNDEVLKHHRLDAVAIAEALRLSGAGTLKR